MKNKSKANNETMKTSHKVIVCFLIFMFIAPVFMR